MLMFRMQVLRHRQGLQFIMYQKRITEHKNRGIPGQSNDTLAPGERVLHSLNLEIPAAKLEVGFRFRVWSSTDPRPHHLCCQMLHLSFTILSLVELR